MYRRFIKYVGWSLKLVGWFIRISYSSKIFSLKKSKKKIPSVLEKIGNWNLLRDTQLKTFNIQSELPFCNAYIYSYSRLTVCPAYSQQAPVPNHTMRLYISSACIYYHHCSSALLRSAAKKCLGLISLTQPPAYVKSP